MYQDFGNLGFSREPNSNSIAPSAVRVSDNPMPKKLSHLITHFFKDTMSIHLQSTRPKSNGQLVKLSTDLTRLQL